MLATLGADSEKIEAMPKRHATSEESAHDVLAAEEFAMPSRDPGLEPAHDILAAEEFAVPTADPELHHGPVVLPDDPTGIDAPHDILAAEEFAIPASPGPVSLARRHSSLLWRLAAVSLAALLVRTLWTRR